MEKRYNKGKIYTIRSNQTDKFYIGSTCLELYKRLYKHRQRYKAYQKDNNKKYLTSYEIIKFEDHYIELLQEFPCNNKMELEKREGELIREYLNNIVNKYIPKRTSKEYREDNKNRYLINNKKWKENNKIKLQEYYKNYDENRKIEHNKWRNEYNKQKIKCECGCLITIGHKHQHLKTKKHLNFINS